MKQKRIMVDLETISSKSNASIVSIGAVYFDQDEVYLDKTFYCVVDSVGGVIKYGRHKDPNTMKWWAQQSPEAKAVLVDKSALDLKDALNAFSLFAGDTGSVMLNPEMWGNGADFDCVILGNSYEACKMHKPWSYANNRCFRTLKNEIKLKPGQFVPREGTHHNALDDAIYQAKVAQKLLANIRSAK